MRPLLTHQEQCESPQLLSYGAVAAGALDVKAASGARADNRDALQLCPGLSIPTWTRAGQSVVPAAS